jgi:quinoprotein glucose dehydrogenase
MRARTWLVAIVWAALPAPAPVAAAGDVSAVEPGPPRAARIADWPVTEGAPGGGRFSPLQDITPENVHTLVPVWHYRHGDAFEGSFPLREPRGSAFESTPIVAGGRLFFTTPRNRVIALDPETGRELWSFDPEIGRDGSFANMWINRGVAYWRDPAASGACSARVLLATLDARLFALDAASGAPCADFGVSGAVDLLDGIAPVYDRFEYNVTSPGTVVGDLVVVGSSVADTLRPDAPPGDVRAFDVRSGALRWTFHTIPRAGEPGFETWQTGTQLTGAVNVWSTMTADLERGLVFLPVSTPSPDFYGGDRPGANLYSDSVVALDAATGERRWHFQTVHHDLWDYDLAAPPNLVRLAREDGAVDAVVQATKHGFVFVLDRETGAPLFPVEERPVPASDLPGERAWPTQPFPLAPPPLVPQRIAEADLYAPTPEHREACRQQLAKLRNDGLFTPPSERGSLLYPFTGGGANWSGAAWDPGRQRLFVPVQNLAHVIRLDRVAERATGGGRGRVATARRVAAQHLVAAHRSRNRAALSPAPVARPHAAPARGHPVQPAALEPSGRRRSGSGHDRLVGLHQHGARRSGRRRLRPRARDRQRPGVPRRHPAPGAARPLRRHRRASRDLRAAGGPPRGPHHLQAAAGRAPAAGGGPGRPRRHALAPRRPPDRLRAAPGRVALTERPCGGRRGRARRSCATLAATRTGSRRIA